MLLIVGYLFLKGKEKPFLMPVEDIFSITGRGTVATAGLKLVLSIQVKKWKSLALAPKKGKQFVQVWKCSGKSSTLVKLVIT